MPQYQLVLQVPVPLVPVVVLYKPALVPVVVPASSITSYTFSSSLTSTVELQVLVS
jgi:hypothetical protein